jgi:AhpD family alkylhydroperoxidase
MSRISPAKTGPLTGLLLRFARRKVGTLAGTTPDGAIGPLEAYAHLPRLLVAYGMFEDATARLNNVPERLKHLAELKAATMSTCEYCMDIGSQIARRSGISDAELLDLARHGDSERFSELDKAVLDYAAGMSRTPVDVSDELFDRLRQHLDERQIVELTNMIALENMRGRFNHALGFGSAGFSEGMVCVVPEGHGQTVGAAAANGAAAHAASA